MGEPFCARRDAHRVRAALLLVPLLLAGCATPAALEASACAEPMLTTLVGPREDGLLARAADEPMPLLYWTENPLEEPVSLYATTLPTPEGALDPAAEPSGAGVRHDVGPRGSAFGGYRWPATAEDTSLVFQVDLAKDGCRRTGVAAASWPLASPEDRDAGAEGKGILVRTGGFWTNGTSFYTNHAGIHEEPGIPKGYLGEYTSDTPLKVYVYADGETRADVPRRYTDAGFALTIAGFNDALKGLPVGTARVAWLAPEEAYTLEGREDHPLYGETLVFWIEAVEVVDLPCTLPQPVCDVPTGPSPPPLPPVPPLLSL